MPRGGRIALVLLQTAFAARPMEVWLDARPLGPAHSAAAMLDASGGLFDRAIVAGAADDERFLVADASEPVARLRFSDGSIAGGSTIVGGDASQSAAIALVGSVAWCHVDATSGQPCIVAENLLAKADGTGTRIACTCREAADVQGLAFALDKGVDALVISDADRVAVDFTTLLSPDEGLLVGSSAKALALVLGETATGGFVPPRPFRVNAGPVHSYVLAAGGKTTYLSEVAAGDTLVVATTDGATREATVGRAKVEPRPCVQVDLQQGGSVFLQQAETVRLAGVAGPLPVTRAQVGDVVLVRPDDKGTHVGQRISVPVDER